MILKIKRFYIYTFIFLLIASVTEAANVYIGKDGLIGLSAVVIDGAIVKGDLGRVEQATKKVIESKNYETLFFYLNSTGGDVQEAMKIGFFARIILATTVVHGFKYYNPDSKGGREFMEYITTNNQYMLERNIFKKLTDKIENSEYTKCYSACVLIFYAGAERFLYDNRFSLDDDYQAKKRENIPVIGLHRPYYEKKYYSDLSPIEAEKEYKKLEIAVSRYLYDMGAPDEIIERMLRTSSKNIDLVKESEFKKLYHKKSPFYEEWLIANCGKSGPENALSEKEFIKYEKLKIDQKKELKKKGTFAAEYFMKHRQEYIPSSFTKEEVDHIFNTMRSHGRRVNSCREFKVKEHQEEWAKSYKQKP